MLRGHMDWREAQLAVDIVVGPITHGQTMLSTWGYHGSQRMDQARGALTHTSLVRTGVMAPS